MADSNSKKTPKVIARCWPWFFFAAAFESLLSVAALFSIPSESGLSLARLILLTIPILIFGINIFFGLRTRRDTAILDSLPRDSFILSSTLLSLTFVLILFLLRYLNPERLLPVYERLSPLLWLIVVIGFQTSLFLLLLKNGFHPQEFLKRKSIYRAACIAFVILIFVFVFVSITKLGITKDTAYWGEPGAAILGWHFVIAILAGFFTLIYVQRIQENTYTGKQVDTETRNQVHDATRNYTLSVVEGTHHELRITNFFLPLFIWLLACALWLTVPVTTLQNSFYSPITPPANIPLPYSDAGFYDYLSQSLLIGTNYLGGIPPRPLYVFFLYILHLLFGQNYIAIIAAQTLVLALFPVSLYFLAKKLHSPAAGVTVAAFAIFRELMGLWIASNTRVTNSKIFTTDFPTALGIAVLCLVVVWWLEQHPLPTPRSRSADPLPAPRSRPADPLPAPSPAQGQSAGDGGLSISLLRPLVAGGAFGLLLLLRTQSLLILPVVFVLAWFVYQRKTKQWILAGVAFGFALALTIAPWLIHNYTVTGKIAFDDPKQMAIIYSQYSFTGNLDLSQFDFEKENLGNHLFTFAKENPAYVAGFITNHFLNTEIGGLLSLPLIERFDGLYAPANLYWMDWPFSLEWYNLLLIIFYLAIIAVGLGAAWKRLRWIGLVPLAFNLGYALSNGISRFSSWRYNLPVDWVVYFYFSIGIIEVFGGLVILFGAKSENVIARRALSPTKQSPRKNRGLLREERSQRHLSFVFILAAFIFVGSLPWFATGFASPRYTTSQNELIAKLARRGYESSQVNSFLSQPGAVLLEGRMLYPRLYRRDQGIASTNPWPAYAIRDYARIGFILLNNNRYDAIFPTRDLLDFPQGADAILLACQRETYLDVRLIAFPNSTYLSTPLTDSCE